MGHVIALVDMDCFFVQVEQRYNPSLKGKPCAVVQYTQRGVIIAVSYEARAFGVKRGMTAEDAKAKCPDILLPRIPELRGKADLTKYREAGAEVIDVFCQFCQCVERASIDEAYLDLTKIVDERMKTVDVTCITSFADQLTNTHVIGWESTEDNKSSNKTDMSKNCKNDLLWWLSSVQFEDIKLAVGAVIVEEMRAAVHKQTGFSCSAGISRNKMLSKLAAGLHKPNQQTVLPHSAVEELFKTMPISKVRNLGGKFGDDLKRDHGIEMMSDLWQFSKEHLIDIYGSKTGTWLHALCRGFDNETVTARQVPKSIGCSKNFLGKSALDTRDKVKHWLKQLATEVEERLIKDKENNKRTATSMITSLRFQSPVNQTIQSSSRTTAVVQYSAEKIANCAFSLLQQFNLSPPHQASWSPPILMLSISVGKFVDIPSVQTGSISALIKKQISNTQAVRSSFVANGINLLNQQTETDGFSQKMLKTSNSKSIKKQSLISQNNTLTSYLKSIEVSQIEPSSSNQRQINCSSTISELPVNADNDNNRLNKDTIEGFFSRKVLENSFSKSFSGVLKPSGSSPDANGISSERDEAESEHTSSFFAMKQTEIQKLKDYSVKPVSSFTGEGKLLQPGHQGRVFENSFPTQFDNISTTEDISNSSNTDVYNEDFALKSCDSSDGIAAPGTCNVTGDEVSVIYVTDEEEEEEKDKEVYASESLRSDTVSVPYQEKSTCSQKLSFDKQTVFNEDSIDSCHSTDYSLHSDRRDEMDYVECQDCMKKILVWDLLEHKDYHFAQQLQRTVDRNMTRGNPNHRTSNPTQKRKIQTARNKEKKPKSNPNMKTLEVFFQRK
ncbi:DNA polymerase eta [Octopus bimaculoides]|nr:DNA polymerase eta [Octopus bimaculoides]